MLPTFFLAGVPKAGTTSLYDYNQHPDVFMSRKKEPHHFSFQDDGWPKWAVRDRQAYEELFAEARHDQARGEASTWTLYSEGAPKRIAEAVPDAKFVVVLRHPTDRAYSNWTFNLGSGYETIDTFEAALEAEPGRVARGGGPWHYHYVRAGFYADQLGRYFDVFGRDRVLVIFFDNLKTDTYDVVRRVYGFIGVDPSFRPDIGVSNRSYLPRSRRLHNLSWSANPLKSALKKILPSGVSAELGRRLKQVNKIDPPKIAPQTQRALDETFQPHIERLSTLLGEDLTTRWLDRSDLPGQKVVTT